MPPQSGKVTPNIMGKLSGKIRKSHEAHKHDEIKLSNFGDLPAGIENGIAYLQEAKIGVYKDGDMKDEPYFMAVGIVVSPTHAPDGTKIEGRRTQLGPEPLCDTPSRGRKTFDDHYAWVLNELRKLGVDSETMDPDNIQEELKALSESQPTFSFRTWKGKKQTTGQYANQEPRTQHQWNGLTELGEEGSSDNGVVEGDEGGVDVVEEEDVLPPPRKAPPKAAPAPAPAPAPKAGGKGAGKPPVKKAPPKAPEPEPEPEPESGDVDVNTLVEQCGSDDPEEASAAQDQLTQMAVAAGYSQEDVDNASGWDVVGEMASSAPPSDEEEATAEWEPQTEEVYAFYPVDPKTKRKSVKPVQCEVIDVDAKSKTVTLKNLVNTAVSYKKVSWEDLVPME